MWTPRRWAGALAVVVATLGVGDTVLADPAGPTDYRSEILSIEPDIASIELEVLGGDSFVELAAEPGTEVVVVGYRNEDYIWFRPDGTVLENRNSPTTYQNQDRYGGDVPDFAVPDAEPDWVVVGSGGRWAWHDHRAHWMQPIRPAGKGPGDRIVEAVIPLVVDGVEIDVTVISTWLEEPSPVPAWGGAVVALGLGGAGVALWRRRRPWVAVAIPIAGLALGTGTWQFMSLPSETDPRVAWWALPALALVAAIGGAIAWRRDAAFVATGAVLLAAAQLAVWGWIKFDGVSAAIVPTGAPGWLDRVATTTALLGGVVLAGLALWELFGPRRELDRVS